MIELISITICMGFFGYIDYKIIELFVMRKERQAIIERLEAADLKEYIKTVPLGVKIGQRGTSTNDNNQPKTELAPVRILRISLTAIGLGLGLLFAVIIAENYGIRMMEENEVLSLLVIALPLLGCSLGLLLSYIIEVIIKHKSKK